MSMSLPVMGFDIPFGADDDAWTVANQYGIWTKRFWPTAGKRLVERPDGAVNEAPETPQAMRLIPAGMPHRIANLFGFWRQSDADTLFFRSEQDEDTRYALVVSIGAVNYKNEQLFWTCPGCRTELARCSFEAKRFGLPAFWEFAAERTREFNADEAARTCKGCGTVHPHALGWRT